MARYEIAAPDGARYEVTAPDSMPEADVLARFRSEVGQPIEVEGPGGVVVEFPAGTSTDVMRDAMRRRFGGAQPEPPPMGWGQYLRGLGREALQGATFDFGDELGLTDRAASEQFGSQYPIASTVARIAGGVAPFVAGPGAGLARLAIGSTLPRTIARSAAFGAGVGGVSGFGAGEGGVAERLPSAAAGAATGAAFGAGLPPAIAGLAKGGRGARKLVGGLSALAFPQTTARLRTALTRGETAEPPVPPVSGSPIEGATFMADGVVPPAPEAVGAQDRALRLMADQLVRSGRSVGDVERALAEFQRSRVLHSRGLAQDATALADVLPGWQRLAGAAGRAYTEAAEDAGRFMTARQTGLTPPGADAQALAQRGLPTVEPFAPPMTGAQAERALGSQFSTPKKGIVPTGHVGRVRDALRRAFLISDQDYHGHTRTGLRTVQQIVQQAEEAAQGSYAAAYRAHEQLNLRSPVLSVFQRHIERAALEQSPNIERYLMKLQNDLFLRPRRSIVLRQFDNSKRQLDNLIADDLAKPKYAHRGAILTQLKNDLLDAVDVATGGGSSLYRAARAEFSDRMSMARAYQLGRRALDDRQTLRRTGPLSELNAGGEVTADAFRALTPGQQKLARFGILDSVTSQAMRKPREREALAIFSTPRVQELLQAAIPRTQTATGRARAGATFADRPQRFGRYLQAERQMLDTRHVTTGNSMTARNIQDDLALAGAETAQNVQGWLDMFRGSTSAWHFGQSIFTRLTERAFGINADTAAELARMLFTANPAERTAILQRLAQIMPADRMTRFNELMSQTQRYGVAPGAAFGGAAAGAPQGLASF